MLVMNQSVADIKGLRIILMRAGAACTDMPCAPAFGFLLKGYVGVS